MHCNLLSILFTLVLCRMVSWLCLPNFEFSAPVVCISNIEIPTFSMPNLEIPIFVFTSMSPKFTPKNKFESFYFQEVLKHWISSNFISEWNSIIWNFQRTTSRDIPKFNSSQTFWKLSWKNSVPYATVSKSSEVWSHGSQGLEKFIWQIRRQDLGHVTPSPNHLSTLCLWWPSLGLFENNNIIALLK